MLDFWGRPNPTIPALKSRELSLTGGRRDAAEGEVRDGKHEGDLIHCCWTEDGGHGGMGYAGGLKLLRGTPGWQPVSEWEIQPCCHEEQNCANNRSECRQILLPDRELQMSALASLLRPRAEEEVELMGTGWRKGGLMHSYCYELLSLW